MNDELQISLELHDGQWKAFDLLNSKYNVLPCGRRWGKSEFAVRWQFCKHVIKGGKTEHDSPHMWLAPIYKQARLGFIKYLRFLRQNSIEHKHNYSELYIDILYKQYRVQFFSLDKPQNIEGFAAKSLVMDEAGIALKNRSAWENSVMFLLADHDAPALFIGTPKGKGLYQQFYLRGQDSNDKEYKSMTGTSYDNTLENNGFLKKQVIDAIVSNMSERTAKQEVFAEFTDEEGNVFRNIKACAIGSTKPRGSGKKYIGGLDLAKVNDWTVLTIGTQKDVELIERFNRLDWNVQKERIANIVREYNCKVLIDSTGVGDPIFEDLRRMGLAIEGYKFTSGSKKQLIDKLILSIENKEITFPYYEPLINELENYEYQITQSGNIKTNAPSGMHDDCVISLALWNWLRSSGAGKLSVEDIYYGEERITSGW